MTSRERSRGREKEGSLLASRLAYHLRYLHEDATDQTLSRVDRLAVGQERAACWTIERGSAARDQLRLRGSLILPEASRCSERPIRVYTMPIFVCAVTDRMFTMPIPAFTMG